MPPEPSEQTEPRWEANLCFTVRGKDAEDVQAKQDKLNATAKRIGVEQGFSDYERPCDAT
jgi:hypothetical protein